MVDMGYNAKISYFIHADEKTLVGERVYRSRAGYP
jgi:hypothetical protein